MKRKLKPAAVRIGKSGQPATTFPTYFLTTTRANRELLDFFIATHAKKRRTQRKNLLTAERVLQKTRETE